MVRSSAMAAALALSLCGCAAPGWPDPAPIAVAQSGPDAAITYADTLPPAERDAFLTQRLITLIEQEAAARRIQEAEAAYEPRPTAADRGAALVTVPGGRTVYRADECIGAVVNGQCHGSILPKAGMRKTCHGEMLNGMCTGPMF